MTDEDMLDSWAAYKRGELTIEINRFQLLDAIPPYMQAPFKVWNTIASLALFGAVVVAFFARWYVAAAMFAVCMTLTEAINATMRNRIHQLATDDAAYFMACLAVGVVKPAQSFAGRALP